MSEEILKALMQLFALITKQDGGTQSNERDYVVNFLNKQLSHDLVNEYLDLFDQNVGPLISYSPDTDNKPPSVKDSVKIFSICKKINRTLKQAQKVVVLMRLYELINADKGFTLQKMNIINTVAEVFRILPEEVKSTESFIKSDKDNIENDSSIFVIIQKSEHDHVVTDSTSEELTDNLIIILWISSVDMYFIKHYSVDQLFLNGLPLDTGKVFTIAKGSSLRYPHGQPLYYSDITSHFLEKKAFRKISFIVKDLCYKFPGGQIGINKISLCEKEAGLIGIMGSSGTGKTTLLNLLSGVQSPYSGSVRINGVDIHSGESSLEGVVGYVPQDDLLIEDLTVFQNLYFAACLCFKKKNKKELTELADKMLISLGIYDKRDLKVGSPLNKVISGGQRKRLNIALELIREPSILFLDEPTSGLSSRDSENIMDLLRDLSLKGKLIFSVIHQPSSEIYKMFDRMLILDQGGEMVYYGNPVEALIHFKTIDFQINSNIGECPTCGNINPENIFNIIETEVVNEFGRTTGKRKILPNEWADKFGKIRTLKKLKEVKAQAPSNLDRPGLTKQFKIFSLRDLRSKLSNKQYILLTLMEAPVLGFILSYITRYIANPSSKTYIFSQNDNIPIYIFMSLIVALFLGLITSAEEIFKDRKIRSREKFLHLSKGSYLSSKVLILFSISALQCFLFVIIANPILGIKGMTMQYWLALFTTAAFANILGLNISSAFNSAITIYIIVPLLMIPMMVLSGAMFSFDKLNRSLGGVDKVPAIADIMPTKWTYEALMVTQFKDNEYEKLIYHWDQKEHIDGFNANHRLAILQDSLNTNNLALIRNELTRIALEERFTLFEDFDKLNPEEFTDQIKNSLSDYIDEIIAEYLRSSFSASDTKDLFLSNRANKERLDIMRLDYHNNKLEEIVRKVAEPNKLLEYRDNFVQNVDPIYLDPAGNSFPAFRSHFFAPTKILFGRNIDTFFFNITVVWLMSISLFILLYFDILKKIVNSFSKK